jgi:hypothetical protein
MIMPILFTLPIPAVKRILKMEGLDKDGAYTYSTKRTSIHAAELEFNGNTLFVTGINHSIFGWMMLNNIKK